MLSKTMTLEKRILQDIQAGHYLPGEKIPSRNWLSARYGYSRTTVERAIASLVKSGFVGCRKGSGTYVISKSGSTDISQLNVIANNPAYMEEVHSELFFYKDFFKIPINWVSFKQSMENIEKLSEPGSATIWMMPGEEQISVMDYLCRKQIPQLLFNREYRFYDCIYTDPLSSLREGLAWLLIETGREIAFVSEYPDIDRSYLNSRIIAFYQVCVELGARLDSNTLFMMNKNKSVSDETEQIGIRLFGRADRPKGIFVSSQDIVLGLVDCAKQYGLKPGKDYFLLTFDFIKELAGYPGIGMLRQPYSLMLREAQRWIAEKNKAIDMRFEVGLKADLIISGGKQ